MATMPLLVVRGDTYQIGLIIECIAAVISLLLLFTSANRRKNFPLSHLAAILWLFVPVSFLFLLQTSLFGSGFEGLFNWARTGVIIGIVAIILTSIQLFRVNRWWSLTGLIVKNKEMVNDNISGKLINEKSVNKKRRVAGLYIQTFTGLLVVFWLYSWMVANLISDQTSMLYKIIAGVVILCSLINVFLLKKWWQRLIWVFIVLIFVAILTYWIGWDLYSDIRF